ncbi:MAG: class I SAM-dependent methyltransferase, partial [Caldilineaceae bacterium]|nr:class I SAM-dependent methyltransferase [Caldilineaceae bacterium]
GMEAEMAQDGALFNRWRANLVRDLTGDILEIGVGKGENLPYYTHADRIWAIEPDLARAEDARAAAVTQSIPVVVDVAPAEHLPYGDDSFDNVVCSLVFCSVTEPETALAEIQRVLRPHGVVHLVEHVRPNNRWLAHFFTRITPWWSTVAYNCHLDRPTIDVLRAAGWTVTIHRRLAVFVRMSAVFNGTTPPQN